MLSRLGSTAASSVTARRLIERIERDSEAGEPGGIGKELLEEPLPERKMVDDRSVEGLEDLRLEPGLLVKADAQVGEQETLGSRLRVGRGQRAVIPPEGDPEMVLAVGWIARPERGAEALDGVLPIGVGALQQGEEAGEFTTDLLEHLQVSPGDRVARPRPRGR